MAPSLAVAQASVQTPEVDADGTLNALVILQAALIHVRFSPRLTARVQHAIARLDQPLEKAIFGTNRIQVPDTEQQVLSMLRSIASDLHKAGSALDVAAEQLKNLGKGFQASNAKRAAQEAHRAAEGLVHG